MALMKAMRMLPIKLLMPPRPRLLARQRQQASGMQRRQKQTHRPSPRRRIRMICEISRQAVAKIPSPMGQVNTARRLAAQHRQIQVMVASSFPTRPCLRCKGCLSNSSVAYWIGLEYRMQIASKRPNSELVWSKQWNGVLPEILWGPCRQMKSQCERKPGCHPRHKIALTTKASQRYLALPRHLILLQQGGTLAKMMQSELWLPELQRVHRKLPLHLQEESGAWHQWRPPLPNSTIQMSLHPSRSQQDRMVRNRRCSTRLLSPNLHPVQTHTRFLPARLTWPLRLETGSRHALKMDKNITTTE